MIFIAASVSFILLTFTITVILDLLNNRNNTEAYKLAGTALNFAIGFVTSLAVHLLIGFNTIGNKLLTFLGFTI